MPYKHEIAEPLRGGLGSNCFSARNPSHFATYYFLHTMVSIAGPLKKNIA
jgi:hypothetical protein